MKKSRNPISFLFTSIVSLIGIIFAKCYVIAKKILDLIVRRIRFSISFKISLTYIKWLIISLILSSILIEGFYCFMSANRIWTEINQLADRLEMNYMELGGSSVKDIPAGTLDENISIYVVSQLEGEIYTYNRKNIHHNVKSEIPVNKQNNTIYLFTSRLTTYKDVEYWLLIYKDINIEIENVLFFFRMINSAHIATIIITVLLGARKNSKVLKPITQMTETAKKISEKNLSLRINVKGTQDELKDLARTINEMMERIEQAYNQQQQFVSDASHELRTPIAVIQGYANMLNRWGKNDPEILDESIESIRNETDNMKDLVEKLLFLARNDKKTLLLQKEDFDLKDLLEEMIKETEIIIDGHKIDSQIGECPLIYGDRNRIKQVLRIFIDNAIKYTPIGGTITVRSKTNKNYAMIYIKDTGIGIPKEDIKYIFDRFYRSDKSRTKEKGGHGLGLAIAKIIILGHEGKIKVKSKLGEGTEFEIWLKK